MQNVIVYVVADSTLGTVRDYVNAVGMQPPVFTRGFPVLLKLRLFGSLNDQTAYPIEQLQGIASWQCVFDRDFNQTTTPILVADNANIIVHSVVEEIEEVEYNYTEIQIPITNMNTAELVAFLGNAESVGGLHMELVGFDSNGNEEFGLQVKNYTVRNRIYYTGTPTEIPQDLLTAAQIRALLENYATTSQLSEISARVSALEGNES